MRSNRNPKAVKYVIIILLIISIILTIVSQFVVWATLDVDTKIGPADATLDAEFYEHGVNYVINVSGNISVGGIIGIGGGLGGNINQEIRENKTFLTGLGEFQENIGLILNSYKDKRHTIKTSILDPQTQEFAETKLWVETQADLIPWWPEGVGQKYTVKVTLSEPGNCKNVVIDNIKVILWRDFDSDKQVYTEPSKPVAQKSPDSVLSKRNESRSFEFDVKVSQDYGRVGVIAVVTLIINDQNGNAIPENTIINLGKTDPMPAAITNNIYTMTLGDGISIVLMVIAFPLSLFAIALMAIAIPFVFTRRRGCFGLVLFATILGVLAILFYISGIGTLVNLLDSVLDTPVRENFTWEATMMIPGSMMGLLIAASIMTFMIRPPKKKGKKKGKGKKKDEKDKAKKEKELEETDEELPAFKSLDKSEEENEQYEFKKVELVEGEAEEEESEPVQKQRLKSKKRSKGGRKAKSGPKKGRK